MRKRYVCAHSLLLSSPTAYMRVVRKVTLNPFPTQSLKESVTTLYIQGVSGNVNQTNLYTCMLYVRIRPVLGGSEAG
jgi:hypothetical protein